ncbi:helix-turn-helix domain-containing protein [Oceanicola sp. S124]|uniref:helix-turn-helix domain-containing protein n=1 Tax=Oceanicola sp. S124 TaxID=1042378 RepID=UPI000255A6AD|nr:helix-turn-helix transcriptional regulator [Oceanicola sp. S124]
MAVEPKIPRENQSVDREAFARRVTFVREKLGLTKKDFADSIGITKSNYSQVEQGNRMLTVDQLYRCFLVHGVPMEYLLVGQEARLPQIFKH